MVGTLEGQYSAHVACDELPAAWGTRHSKPRGSMRGLQIASKNPDIIYIYHYGIIQLNVYNAMTAMMSNHPARSLQDTGYHGFILS